MTRLVGLLTIVLSLTATVAVADGVDDAVGKFVKEGGKFTWKSFTSDKDDAAERAAEAGKIDASFKEDLIKQFSLEMHDFTGHNPDSSDDHNSRVRNTVESLPDVRDAVDFATKPSSTVLKKLGAFVDAPVDPIFEEAAGTDPGNVGHPVDDAPSSYDGQPTFSGTTTPVVVQEYFDKAMSSYETKGRQQLVNRYKGKKLIRNGKPCSGSVCY